MLRLLASILAALALALAAGCGGSDNSATKTQSKADYSRQVEQTRTTLSEAFTDIGKGIGKNASPKDIGSRLDQGATALNDAADRFAKIAPPAEVKDAHAKLVAGLRELADVFARSADAARKGDTAELAKSLQNVQATQGAKKISDAADELKKKGYSLPTG